LIDLTGDRYGRLTVVRASERIAAELRELLGARYRRRVVCLLIDSNGRTIWIVDAHRDDGKRFVVRAELTALLELESTIRQASG
jgi:hypothetical protein